MESQEFISRFDRLKDCKKLMIIIKKIADKVIMIINDGVGLNSRYQ